MNKRIRIMPFLGGIFCLLLVSCLDFGPEQGEVARINGEVITLSQLEAMQESLNLNWGGEYSLAPEGLHKEYGAALTELLAAALVKQQLEKKKLGVTDEELAAQEALIRADYPAGTFEAMLVSNAINSESWRFLLRNNLSVVKFQQQLLRPDIPISSEEVEAYYQAHQEEFRRPERGYFILITGQDKAAVTTGREMLLATADAVRVQSEMPELLIQTVRIAMNRLAPDIQKDLRGLKPGQMSGIMQGDEGFRSVLLLEHIPEQLLSLTESYPIIEKILVADKLEAVYNEWLNKRFEKANIKVTRHLLPQPAPKKMRNSTEQGGGQQG